MALMESREGAPLKRGLGETDVKKSEGSQRQWKLVVGGAVGRGEGCGREWGPGSAC